MDRGQATALHTGFAGTALVLLGLLIPFNSQAGSGLPPAAPPDATAQPLAMLDSCITDHGAGMLGLVHPTASRKRQTTPKARSSARRTPRQARPPQAEAPAEEAPMVYRTFLSCIGPAMEETEILHSFGATGLVRRT